MRIEYVRNIKDAGIVKAVEKHGHQIAGQQIPLHAPAVAIRLAQLRPAIKQAHEHREGHVSRHRQQRPGQSHREAVIQYVLDILKSRESQ